MSFDSFRCSTSQTKNGLFRSNFMPHPCWYVYKLVLHFQIPDIITGTTKGFDYINGKGGDSKVFLDICGFLGDYSALCQVLDVMQVMAKPQGTHCSFRYRSCKVVPKYSNITEINSGRRPFCWTFDRTIELRSDSKALSDIASLHM